MNRIILTMVSGFIFTSLFLFPGPASAEIRGYVDSKGFFRFPGLKQSKPTGTVGRAAPLASYEKIIDEASGMYSVETDLVKAVIRAESAFNPTAVSHKGALGLMQLMPSTVSLMEVKDPFDPADNVHGGTRYLALLLRRYKGDKLLALAAYNAGPEKVDIYQGVPPYAETRMYVRKVMQYYKFYSGKWIRTPPLTSGGLLKSP
jgi:soluble lytic murein transglycosylase